MEIKRYLILIISLVDVALLARASDIVPKKALDTNGDPSSLEYPVEGLVSTPASPNTDDPDVNVDWADENKLANADGYSWDEFFDTSQSPLIEKGEEASIDELAAAKKAKNIAEELARKLSDMFENSTENIPYEKSKSDKNETVKKLNPSTSTVLDSSTTDSFKKEIITTSKPSEYVPSTTTVTTTKMPLSTPESTHIAALSATVPTTEPQKRLEQTSSGPTENTFSSTIFSATTLSATETTHKPTSTPSVTVTETVKEMGKTTTVKTTTKPMSSTVSSQTLTELKTQSSSSTQSSSFPTVSSEGTSAFAILATTPLPITASSTKETVHIHVKTATPDTNAGRSMQTTIEPLSSSDNRLRVTENITTGYPTANDLPNPKIVKPSQIPLVEPELSPGEEWQHGKKPKPTDKIPLVIPPTSATDVKKWATPYPNPSFTVHEEIHKDVEKTTPTEQTIYDHDKTTVASHIAKPKTNKTIDDKKHENEIIKNIPPPYEKTYNSVPTERPSPPPVYIRLELLMTWPYVCALLPNFKQTISLIFRESSLGVTVFDTQVYVMSESLFCHSGRRRRRRDTQNILLEFYMVRTSGHFTPELTRDCAGLLVQGHDRLQQLFKGKYVGFSVLDSEGMKEPMVINKNVDVGSVIAMVLAPLAGVCLILLLTLQLQSIRRRPTVKAMRPYVTADHISSANHNHTTSLDSVTVSAMLANAYPVSFYNEGMEMDYAEPSNPVIFKGVDNYTLDMEAIETEFKRLPNYMPRLSEVPRGAEGKNRYANVVPLPETRVQLEPRLGDRTSDYINANYVKGFLRRNIAYIATQAPLPHTIPDFWRMVWEHQSKLIIMLNSPGEFEQNKFSDYWPYIEQTGSMCMYGDYQVLLKYREQRNDYTLSTLELKNLEKNLCREVHHFWFTGWPQQGVPKSARSLLRFLMEIQPYVVAHTAPTVVHCSPGTGRTGVVLTLDIGMKSIVQDHCADIVNIVYHLRRERAGSVQTREQYAFIHVCLNEYAAMLRKTPVIRPNMSIGSSLDALESSIC